VINVLACDPGLATFGALIIQTDGRRHVAVRAGVFRSVPRVAELDIHVGEDRRRRTRELLRWLDDFTHGFDIQVCVAEEMSFPRSHAAIVSISLAWGALTSFLEDRRLPCVAALPTVWRSELVGRPRSRAKPRDTEQREDASHAKAVSVVPSAVPVIAKLGRTLQPHALDALGVFVWSLSHHFMRHMFGGGR